MWRFDCFNSKCLKHRTSKHRKNLNKFDSLRSEAKRPHESDLLSCRAQSALTACDLSKQRANLAGPCNICLCLYIGHFRLVSASSVNSRSICISGSWCTIVSFMLSDVKHEFFVCKRNFYTIGESRANSFNVNAHKANTL